MNERITAAQIARIRSLNKKRSPGHWHVVGDPWGDGSYIVAGNGDPHVSRFVCDCEDPNPESDDRDYSLPDAAFIAAVANLIIPALDEIGRLTQAIGAIQVIAHAGVWGNDDEMQAALELIERHCAIAAPSPAEEGTTGKEPNIERVRAGGGPSNA